MLVDQVGEVLITNDGATILKRLDVEHPAGKVLVELAELQDKEVSRFTLFKWKHGIREHLLAFELTECTQNKRWVMEQPQL